MAAQKFRSKNEYKSIWLGSSNNFVEARKVNNMVEYPGEIKPLPTEGLYWQITAFFKTAMCEQVRLVLSTCFVMILVIFDFAGIAYGYMVLPVHPALGFFLLVSDFLDTLPPHIRPGMPDLTPFNFCLLRFYLYPS